MSPLSSGQKISQGRNQHEPSHSACYLLCAGFFLGFFLPKEDGCGQHFSSKTLADFQQTT
jgi:hypothetical protein